MNKYKELTEELAANNKITAKVIAIVAHRDEAMNTAELMDYRYRYLRVYTDRKIEILDEIEAMADLVERAMLMRDLCKPDLLFQ